MVPLVDLLDLFHFSHRRALWPVLLAPAAGLCCWFWAAGSAIS
jgi:hypothetical protein